MTTPIEIVINGKDNTGGAFSSASGGLAKIGQIAAGILTSQVFTQLASAAVDFGKSVFTEAMDAQLVMADLDAVLKSTGGQAGVTRDSAMSLAEGLSTMTRFSDDAILKGENMLLTFTNIGKDVFPMATEAMLNMATKMGTDAAGSAIQLGKALNDPIGGITALRRVGVQFTDEQEKQIKTMVEAGDVMGAQKMILAELETEFGGAAKAAGGTFAGQMDILKNKFNNLKEGLGLKLLPVLQSFTDKLIAFADNPAVIKFFDDLADGAIKIIEWIGQLPAIFDKAGGSIAGFIKPFLPALRQLMNTFELMRPSLEKTADVLGGKLAEAGKALAERIMPFLVTQFSRFSRWVTENRPLIERFAAVMGERFGAMAEKMVLVWGIIEPILSGLLLVILGIGKAVMQVATGDWAGAWQTMQNILSDAWAAISASIIAAAEWLASYFGGGTFASMKAQWAANWAAFKSIVIQVWGIIKSTIAGALNALKAAFSAAWNGIIGGVRSFASGLVGALSNAISSAVNGAAGALGGFISLGGKIIDNIITGLNNAKASLLSYLKGIISGLVGGLFGGGGGGGGGSVPGGGACFISGTMVLMSNGTIKRIEDVAVGDSVMSFDCKSKQLISSNIIEVYHHKESPYKFYMVINGYLGVTPNHPMYINGEWTEADLLQVGDLLLNSSGEPVKVHSINWVCESVPVFNLHTDSETHNYFAGGVLVHNKALGGDVRAGYAYPVGEVGREMFIAPANGTIIPNNQLGRMGGNKSVANYYNAHIVINQRTAPEPRQVLRGLV